ncbi:MULTISPECIES: hypothetical protein [unclassified Fusibacter]|uniref:hypothetical protein n=1 Tax=unclassified Fusibacter TaxID=2624464 RepID=UPI0010126C09|nr:MULTISPECIES: hypothetical protein [unclassified Fusibacter]MCK8061094.1 hypothetical protein [Fusibacter sp. A2]NPE23370.1 hypothetical protein [Fusibacter sp. A1]RXV59415.1 hypothetical protein DWB64_16250 [Fusibacter sp. A1]
MPMTRFKRCRSCRRRLALLLIVLGFLVTLAGIVLLVTINTDSTSEADPYDETELTVDVMTEAMTEVTAEATTESTTEALSIPHDPVYFEGANPIPVGITVMKSDGTVLKKGDFPTFHAVSSISAESGMNPETNEASENLLIVMSALPDRYMSVAVIIATDQPEITSAAPDLIEGLQWTLVYSGEGFKKTARSVAATGEITEHVAEGFNIRFVGNEDNAEVEFFGPVGTHYYAVMIYDDTYFTLILP